MEKPVLIERVRPGEVEVPEGYELFAVSVVQGTPATFARAERPEMFYATFVPTRDVVVSVAAPELQDAP